MSTPSTQDLTAPFDPTGYITISGADLLTLIQGTHPYLDKGMVVVTTDSGSSPNVPDATSTTEWQRYIWVRQSATQVSAYAWAANGATDPTYLNWVSLTIAGIGVGSIIGSMIADNTITDIKIVSLDYSKLTGAVPANLPPTGAAGGMLTGTYPNPSVDWTQAVIGTSQITNLAVTSDKINTAAVTGVKIASEAVNPSTHLLGNGVVANQIRVAADGLAMEFFTPQLITNLVNPSITDASKIVQVNPGGTGFQLVQSATLGNVLQTITTIDYSYTSIATTIPYDDTIPQISEGTALTNLSQSITPISTSSKILVEIFISMEIGINNKAIIALFENAGANAVAAVAVVDASTTGEQPGVLRWLLGATGSLTPIAFQINVGSSAGGTLQVNGSGGARKLGGVQGSSIKITEYA